MNNLITAKINVLKIDKDLLYKGEKGLYLDLIIWINSEPDKYGNDISIQQRTEKDAPKIYLGNGKTFEKTSAETVNSPLPEKDDLPW